MHAVYCLLSHNTKTATVKEQSHAKEHSRAHIHGANAALTNTLTDRKWRELCNVWHCVMRQTAKQRLLIKTHPTKYKLKIQVWVTCPSGDTALAHSVLAKNVFYHRSMETCWVIKNNEGQTDTTEGTISSCLRESSTDTVLKSSICVCVCMCPYGMSRCVNMCDKSIYTDHLKGLVTTHLQNKMNQTKPNQIIP